MSGIIVLADMAPSTHGKQGFIAASIASPADLRSCLLDVIKGFCNFPGVQLHMCGPHNSCLACAQPEEVHWQESRGRGAPAPICILNGQPSRMNTPVNPWLQYGKCSGVCEVAIVTVCPNQHDMH